MEVEKEDKQRYLTEHILNNNYDGDEFLDYCCEFVGNADVDSWSFRDLENVPFSLPRSSRVSSPVGISHKNPRRLVILLMSRAMSLKNRNLHPLSRQRHVPHLQSKKFISSPSNPRRIPSKRKCSITLLPPFEIQRTTSSS